MFHVEHLMCHVMSDASSPCATTRCAPAHHATRAGAHAAREVRRVNHMRRTTLRGLDAGRGPAAARWDDGGRVSVCWSLRANLGRACTGRCYDVALWEYMSWWVTYGAGWGGRYRGG